MISVTSRSSNDQRVVRMGLASGNVAAVEITPPIDEKPDRNSLYFRERTFLSGTGGPRAGLTSRNPRRRQPLP